MEATLRTSAHEGSWEVVPANAVAGVVLFLLVLYLFFRHMLLVLMIADMLVGWLRRFAWFPKEGRRRRTVVQWLAALGLVVGYLILARFAGWLDFVPLKPA